MLIPLDVRNKPFMVGQQVARAYTSGGGLSAGVGVCTVTGVVGMKVYLNNSRMPMKFPERLAILDFDRCLSVIA
jgi:hypothetical protein